MFCGEKFYSWHEKLISPDIETYYNTLDSCAWQKVAAHAEQFHGHLEGESIVTGVNSF